MTDTFETFYKRFPRRVKPHRAMKAYEAALKVATHEEIMEGLERFIAAEPWHGELKFCPHPATWLNDWQWKDEYDDTPGEFGHRQTATEALRVVK